MQQTASHAQVTPPQLHTVAMPLDAFYSTESQPISDHLAMVHPDFYNIDLLYC